MPEETPTEDGPKRSFVRIKVRATLDSAGGKKTGFLYIDRKTGAMYVRPAGSKKYVAWFGASEVADFIVKNAFYAEQGIAKRFAPRRAKRRGG